MAYRIISTACTRKLDKAILSGLRGNQSISLKVSLPFGKINFHLISQLPFDFSQLKHDLAFLTRNDERLSLFEAFLKQWRVLLSGETPKGLDRVFAKPPKVENDEKKEAKSEESAKPPPSSKSPSDTNKPPPDWNFGMFGPTAGPNKQGSGKQIPIGGGEPNPDQTKMLIYGALGFAAFVAALTYFEMGYKEISWKDFVNK